MVEGAPDSEACFAQIVRSEQQSKPPKHFLQSRRPEDADTFIEPAPVDRAKLRDVHDAGHLKSRLPTPKANVARHARKSKVGSHRRDDDRGNRASVEAIVLDNQGGATPGGLRTLRGAEVQPVHLALADHQRSVLQSVPASSNSLASRL